MQARKGSCQFHVPAPSRGPQPPAPGRHLTVGAQQRQAIKVTACTGWAPAKCRWPHSRLSRIVSWLKTAENKTKSVRNRAMSGAAASSSSRCWPQGHRRQGGQSGPGVCPRRSGLSCFWQERQNPTWSATAPPPDSDSLTLDGEAKHASRFHGESARPQAHAMANRAA